MATPELPSFDLVVATVDRSDPLERLLDSLVRQTHRRFRVLLVDQNEDDRLGPLVARHGELEIVHLRAPRGLSRARNAALGHLSGEIVAFPDDDCVYEDELLERVARTFAARPELAGISGRAVALDGSASPGWKSNPATLERDNLWNRVISFGIFLRSEVVARVGEFDQRLGLGSGEASASGEEIDYLVRALDAGARIEYDPELTIGHDEKVVPASELDSRGFRDGASVGFILRKHRYPARVLARMVVRPVGGVLRALVGRDPGRARFHAAVLRGRIAGYRRAGRAG